MAPYLTVYVKLIAPHFRHRKRAWVRGFVFPSFTVRR